MKGLKQVVDCLKCAGVIAGAITTCIASLSIACVTAAIGAA